MQCTQRAELASRLDKRRPRLFELGALRRLLCRAAWAAWAATAVATAVAALGVLLLLLPPTLLVVVVVLLLSGRRRRWVRVLQPTHLHRAGA